MTFKKYIYTLFWVLLISAPIAAQQKNNADQMTKRAKNYVFQQKDKIGKTDKTLNLKLTKMYATDRTIKIVYTKGNTNFTSLFPEMTEGKFKTEAQENRYVARTAFGGLRPMLLLPHLFQASSEAMSIHGLLMLLDQRAVSLCIHSISRLRPFVMPSFYVMVRCRPTSRLISASHLLSVRYSLC